MANSTGVLLVFHFLQYCLMNPVISSWKYPALIAHRGAGKHAPENTLAAMREGAKCGYTMFEYDVKLSKDGVAILLHDDTLDRTSTGTGLAGEHTLAELMELDFGSWHSPAFIAEPILTLNGVARFTISNNIHSNIEIKPTTGREAETGAHIARLAAKLWQEATLPPLLSSFSTIALKAARLAAPEMPRAWLIDNELPTDWLAVAADLNCSSINLNNKYASADTVRAITAEGYAVCVWTANEPDRIRELLQWGCHSVITDAIHAVPPDFAQ